jgi:hypothetical protein
MTDRIIYVIHIDVNVWGVEAVPEIELLTLANHAEAINGLLYMMGAGWTDHWRQIPPEGNRVPPVHFGIGIAILVPWDETNRRHHVVVGIENSDGREVIRVESDVEIGRPPGSQPGQDFRSVLAINANVDFPAAGTYRVVVTAGQSQKRVAFRVNDVPAPPLATRP